MRIGSYNFGVDEISLILGLRRDRRRCTGSPDSLGQVYLHRLVEGIEYFITGMACNAPALGCVERTRQEYAHDREK